jgi:hypothetical protein
MGWMRLAWVVLLVPAGGGCNVAYYAGRNLVNEPKVVLKQVCIDHKIRQEAKAAWAKCADGTVDGSFPDEFRDGFIDGYADYVGRGGGGQLPITAPDRYTRDKRYATAEGQNLLRAYFQGFQYGTDVAIAGGRRPTITTPVLIPPKYDGPPIYNIQPGGAGGRVGPDTPLPPLPPVSPPRSIPGAGAPLPGPKPAAPTTGATSLRPPGNVKPLTPAVAVGLVGPPGSVAGKPQKLPDQPGEIEFRAAPGCKPWLDALPPPPVAPPPG